LHTTGARLRAWLRASLNQQALGGRLLVLYRCQALLAKGTPGACLINGFRGTFRHLILI